MQVVKNIVSCHCPQNVNWSKNWIYVQNKY